MILPWLLPLAYAGAIDGLPSVVGDPGSGPWAPLVTDLDGDGIEELTVGFPWADRGGHEAGMVAWIPDPRALAPLTPLDDATDAFLVGDEPQGNVGYALAAPGDLDGDGYDDFAAGAPHRSDQASSSGSVFIVYGGTQVAGTAQVLDPQAWNGVDRLVGGTEYGRLGMRVYGAPDLNDDGRVDLLIAAPAPTPSGSLDRGWVGLVETLPRGFEEASILVSFSPNPASRNVVGLHAVWIHDEVGSLAGRSATTIPDIDGDGREEMILGVPGYASPGQFDKLGRSSGAAFPIQSAPIQGDVSRRFRETGEALAELRGDEPGDSFPWQLLTLSDGRVLGTAPEAANAAGRAFLLSDLDQAGTSTTSERASATLTGPPWSLFGHGVADAEGLFDGAAFAVGAPGAVSGFGSAFLFEAVEGEVDGSTDHLGRIDGCWTGGQVGHALHSAVVDGERLVAITAPFASVHAELDGVIAIVGPQDQAALDATCTHGDYSAGTDQDGDGYTVDQDCDDLAAWVNAGAIEVCGDGVDDDCDGQVDEDCGPPLADDAPVDEGCGGCGGIGAAGWAPVALALLALRRRARRGGAVLGGATLALGLVAAPSPAHAQALDALQGAEHRLWGSDPEERLVGPVLTGALTDPDGTDLAIANRFGIQSSYSPGEVQIVHAASLPEDLWLGHAPLTLFGATENVNFGASVAVVDEGEPTRALYVGIDHTGLDQTEKGELAVFRDLGRLGWAATTDQAALMLSGERNGDSFGAIMDHGADLDQDGQLDLVVSAPSLAWRRDFPARPPTCPEEDWVEPRRMSGVVYLVHGGLAGRESTGGQSLPIAQRESCSPDALDSAASVATGALTAWDDDESTWFGWRVLTPGDLDGDGIEDLVIGSLQPDLEGAVHVFLGPFPSGDSSRSTDDADGSWITSRTEATLGYAMDAAPDGGSLVISSPWADQGAGRIWKVEGVPAGAVDIDEVAVASAGGPEASGFGYALAWGEALLVGAPYGDQVQVLDDQLQPLHVLGGADGLGAWVGWLEDGILEADGVPDVGIIANAATDTFPLQGVALVLDGQQVLDGALPPLADDSEDGALDLDGDGSPATEDCDDADPRRAPGAPEACDGLDNDCDGDTDEDACDGGGGCTTSPTGRGRAGLALLGSALLLAVARQRRGPRGGARRRHLAGLALLFGSLAGCASAPEPPPTLNLRFQDPVDGQPLDPDNLYGDVQLTATGDLARIALVVDGELLAVEDATMVSATWSATDPGAHEVLAEGWDAEGAPLREWRIAHVNAALGDDLAPAVRLTRPVEAEVKVGTELSIAMNVLDDRWIDSATLTVDGALIGQWPEIDAPQWAADVLFPGFEEGPHTIELRARDLAGNEAVDVHELEAVVAN